MTGRPIVVVGGGTAGCTVVAQLAARTTREIVLVEPGDPATTDSVPGFFDVLATPGVTAVHEMRFVDDGPWGAYVQANVLGGGSAVNGMILSGEEPVHLRGMTRQAETDEIGAMSRALLASGGRMSRLWWNGGRWNPAREVAHLESEGRVTVIRDHVQEIVHRNGFVDGIRTHVRDIAADAVVMCAGALVTPAILLRSGLGDFAPGIGRGLQDHPTITFTVRLHAPTTARFDAAVVREWTNEGARLMNIAFERADAGSTDLGLLSVSLMNPTSRGSVRLDNLGNPLNELRLLSTTSDRRRFRKGVLDTAKLLDLPAFSEAVAIVEPFDDGSTHSALADMDDGDLDRWMLAHVGPVSHASGTCAAAVDVDGRVDGTDGLFVADASMLPGVPPTTTAAPVTMAALRIARTLGDHFA